MNEIKTASLKREIEVGIEDLDHGRFQIYDEANLVQLVNDIRRRGRIRFNALRLKVAAKMQKKI